MFAGPGFLGAAHESGVSLVAVGTLEVLNLPLAEGGQPLSPGLNAAASDGAYAYVGTGQGIFRFEYPGKALRLAPRLSWEEISIFLERRADSAQHRFSHDENHLSFQFTGIWFQDPAAVSYEYQLSGHDLGWISTREPRVIYPRLAPGEYTFRVRVGLEGDYSSGAMLTYRFRIAPPFWQQAWFVALLCAGGLLLLAAWIRRRERRLQAQARREQERIRFEFETLRSQVNPHFLFNSFNTLAATIEQDPAAGVAYVNHLSDLFRSILSLREKTTLSLREEYALLQDYLYLQEKRYGPNLILETELPDSAMALHLPPLTLQMLIENAIKHNVVSSARPLVIHLRAEGPWLTVSNVVQRRRNAPPSTGLGLQNIRDRCRLLTPRPVEVREAGGTFSVTLPLLSPDEIPAHESPADGR